MTLPPIQLFNLADDPSETNNLYLTNKDKVRGMYRLLESYVENGRSTPGPRLSNEGITPIDPDGFFKLKLELGL